MLGSAYPGKSVAKVVACARLTLYITSTRTCPSLGFGFDVLAVFAADGLLFASGLIANTASKLANITTSVFESRFVLDATCALGDPYNTYAQSTQFIVVTDDYTIFTFGPTQLASYGEFIYFANAPVAPSFDSNIAGFPVKTVRASGDSFGVVFGALRRGSIWSCR